MSYKTPQTEVIYRSPSINFKNTGNTIIFTTGADKFAVIDSYIVCTSATAASGDAVFNLGWTGPTYQDYVGAIPNPVNNADTYLSFGELTGTESTLVPASTAFRIQIDSADSGTALTGYVVIRGFTA